MLKPAMKLPIAMMLLSTCLAQEPKQSRSSVSPQAECDALFREISDAYRQFNEGTHKARTNEEARKFTLPDGTAYAARFLAMARAYPDDPVAADALVRVILVDFAGPHWKEAIERIKEKHTRSPRIGEALSTIAVDTTLPIVEPLLREVLKYNPSGGVRAEAAVALGQHLRRLADEAENMRAHPDRFDHAVARFGRDYVTRMRDRDVAAMRRESVSLYDLVVREFGQARVENHYPRWLSPVEAAQAELRSIRDLVPGKPAPEIVGTDVDGKSMRLGDTRGKVVVLSFWATWCGPCMAMIPHERELVHRLEGKPFVLLGVNVDEDKERLRFQTKDHQINWRSFYDGGPLGPISRSWNVHGWPTVFVIDAGGVIRYKGARDEKKLDEAVEESLKSER
jgi:thiol-disulfide isomerase/thioredoxin